MQILVHYKVSTLTVEGLPLLPLLISTSHFLSHMIMAWYFVNQPILRIMPKLPILTVIKFILNGWLRIFSIQSKMLVSASMIFSAANSTMYLVSIVDGTMLFKELNSAEAWYFVNQPTLAITSKLPSSTGIKSILDGWFRQFSVQSQMIVSSPMIFLAANSTLTLRTKIHQRFCRPNPTTIIHKDHPLDQVIVDLQSATQTRRMSKNLEEHGFVSTIQQRTNHKDLQNCLFACFLSQEEPKKTLVDLPNGKRAIGTKWVFRNKKDKLGIMIRNKARLVAQGYTQEEGIYYDEVFAHIARIEAIRLFLAYASFKDFVVYQMDVNSAFLYRKIEEEVYVCQPPRFEDPDIPDRVYKVEKALYGLHQAPRAWYETLSTYLLDNEFQRGKIDKTLFIKRYKGDILLVQVYVDDIIFDLKKKELCNAFEKLMREKIQMSSIG
ncbi:putative ribonuclease H-like domain-containing protein [Tanacetum coccineum]